MNNLPSYEPEEIKVPDIIKSRDKFIITIGIKDFELNGDEYAQIFKILVSNNRGLFYIERTGEFIDLKNFISAKRKESKEPKIFGEDIKI